MEGEGGVEELRGVFGRGVRSVVGSCAVDVLYALLHSVSVEASLSVGLRHRKYLWQL